MSELRPELRAIVSGLVARSHASCTLTLDELGEAIGLLPAGADEIEIMITALEQAGLRVVSGRGEPQVRRAAERSVGEALLAKTLEAARALRVETGRVARVSEVAERAGLSVAEVEHALSLARIMQR